MSSRPLVLPEHGPTLPGLLGTRGGPRAVRAAAVVVALLGLALLYSILRPVDDGTDVVRREGPVQFNLRYTPPLARVEPQGEELLRLEGRRGDLFIQSFSVEPLMLEPYRGALGGVLAVRSAREIDALRARFAEFELVQDGKTRVNEVSGSTILFRARLGKRRLYGRVILLPEPAPGARKGVRILMLSTPAGGVSRAAEVGIRGAVKRPYRTFRFGTEKP